MTPLELFFDLVFAFAFAQVTTFLWHPHMGVVCSRALLLLGPLWWPGPATPG